MSRNIEAPSRRVRAGSLLIGSLSTIAMLTTSEQAAAASHPVDRPAAVQVLSRFTVDHCGIPGMLTVAANCHPARAIDRVKPKLPGAVTTSPAATSPWETWAHSPFAVALRECESSDNPQMQVDNGGTKYYGLYSDNQAFWDTYGGLQYAAEPNQATREQQDHVNFEGFLSRDREPWACSEIVDRHGKLSIYFTS